MSQIHPTAPPFDTRKGPLAGIRVIDAATVIAAPFCATLLGEAGADVLTVEPPECGDALRRFGTPTACGDTLTWLSEGRNKRSLTLDLRSKEGAQIFKDLIAQTDVLCENFRTGTLEKWGLGWEVLHEINPRLVMLRVTGYGQTGPYSDRPGFARVAHAARCGGAIIIIGNNRVWRRRGAYLQRCLLLRRRRYLLLVAWRLIAPGLIA